MMRYTPFLLALIAMGCSEAQICRSQATSALRSLERQISVAEQNVSRGYELIERPGRREYSPAWCPDIPKPPRDTRPGARPSGPGPGPAKGPGPDKGPGRGSKPADRAELAPTVTPQAPPPEAQKDVPAPSVEPAAEPGVTRSGASPASGDLVSRGPRRACPSPFPPDPVYEARPINVEAERAKLASLVQQRNRILPATQQALAACPVD